MKKSKVAIAVIYACKLKRSPNQPPKIACNADSLGYASGYIKLTQSSPDLGFVLGHPMHKFT